MDLTFTEDQQTIAQLAGTIIGDLCAPDELRRLEQLPDRGWATETWAKLAEADLLGLGLPEAVGGGGYGLIETALVIEQAAAHAAPLPLYASLVLGAAPIAEYGTIDQQARWLQGVVAGTTVLSGCLVGAADVAAVERPPVVARPDGDDFVLTGEAWYVPYAIQAAELVVPVTYVDGRGVGLVVVDPTSAGVTMTSTAPMSGELQATVNFSDVRIDTGRVLKASTSTDGAALRWVHERALAATCVAQTGTCAGALALTARYVSEREQFGSKLATFQAVSQRAADAYTDTELVRLTAWYATWRLSEGLDAVEELHVAKMFAGEAAQRVVAAAQHLHGGIGVDLDYPVHRYYRWAKTYELRLGSGAAHAAALGARLAADVAP